MLCVYVCASDSFSVQGKGAVKVLTKYLSMFHDLAAKLMPSAIETASHGSGHFAATVRVLAGGPVGALLPELAVGLVLLQLKCPLLVLENDCLTNLLSTLVNSLDKFNRLAPGIHEEDEEDLAWPGVKSMFLVINILLKYMYTVHASAVCSA